MWLSLLRKEFKETFWLSLGMGRALLWLLSGRLPLFSFFSVAHMYSDGNEMIPFLQSESSQTYVLILAVGAVALGFWQTLWEAGRQTYLFLLHRPIARRSVFLAKLSAGGLVYLLMGGGYILILGIWAATPGTHPHPFFWGMTSFSWQMLAAVSLLYPAAFLSGLRPARWFGSRLLPIPFAALMAGLACSPTLPWGLLIVMATHAALISSILWTAQSRDYP